jgi:hypothetical protein
VLSDDELSAANEKHSGPLMRGKDFNTGLRGVLFEARHYERMGAAVWPYGWLVLRQTHQHGELGCVLGGSPVSYREIEEETGFKRRTLECWMRVLRRQGYIETSTAPGGVIVRITKAKKFAQAVRNSAEGIRESARGVRKDAVGFTQSRVANERKSLANKQVADRISSSYVVGTIDKEAKTENPNLSCGKLHKTEQNEKQNRNQHQNQDQRQNRNAQSSGLGSNRRQEPYRSQAEIAREQYIFLQEARMRWAELRKQREEETRRELYVGTNPDEKGRRL